MYRFRAFLILFILSLAWGGRDLHGLKHEEKTHCRHEGSVPHLHEADAGCSLCDIGFSVSHPPQLCAAPAARLSLLCQNSIYLCPAPCPAAPAAASRAPPVS